jgi:diguanylate cyclase
MTLDAHHRAPVSPRTVGRLAILCCASFAAYFLVPSDMAQATIWPVSGFGAFAVLVLGVIRNRPSKRWPWYALAAGAALSNAGDLIYTIYVWRGLEPPDVGIADIPYLAAYLPLLAAAWGMLSRGTRRQDQENTLDALIMALGAAALGYVAVVRPLLADGATDTLAGVIVLGYPVLDLFIFAMLCRVAFGGLRRNVSVWLVSGGMVSWIVGDLAYLPLEAPPPVLQDAVDQLWLVGYWLFALAAMHPSMTRIGTKAIAPHRPPPAPRLAGLLVAGLLSPVLVAVLGAYRPAGQPLVVLGCIGAVLFLVVSLRMWLLVSASNLHVRELAAALETKHELETTLRRMAMHDPLTDLANRAAFTDTVTDALATSRRGLLVMIDLDGFKDVNDTLGHAAGDRLLVAAALRFGRTLRAEDLLARLGGDEFAAWLPEVRTEHGARLTADRLTACCRQPFALSGAEASVTASVGAALAVDGDDVDTLLARADHAMYEAKRGGKNAFVLAGGRPVSS